MWAAAKAKREPWLIKVKDRSKFNSEWDVALMFGGCDSHLGGKLSTLSSSPYSCQVTVDVHVQWDSGFRIFVVKVGRLEGRQSWK